MLKNINRTIPTVQTINRMLKNQMTTGDFYDRCPVYLFTNENISEYMPVLLKDTVDANVLTVCASGDHAFEALLAGAKSIDTFDINSSQRAVLELKTRMIRDVDYEKFMDFFFSKEHFFDTRIISGIKHGFSDALRGFMLRYDKLGRDMFRYRGSHPDSSDIFKISYVANPEKYYLLRDKLSTDIKFQTCELQDIPTVFAYKYDAIALSNIIDYAFPFADGTDDKWMSFYRHILYPMTVKNLVSDNGKICFEYLWGVKKPDAWPDFLSRFEHKYVHQKLGQTGHTFSTYCIDAMDRNAITDMVIMLNQNQKQK